MAINQVETPGIPSGNEKQQLEQMYRYMARLADDLNISLKAIGGNELTDEERIIMQQILVRDAEDAGIPEEDAVAKAGQEMESLKSLIIKTAKFVQTTLQEYRMNLLRETVAEGQFGKYVRRTGLDMVVTPEGITQNYTLQDIVTGLSNYEVNAKNYIKTGLLRTVSSIPVYGVAVGKDIVTFTQDGREIYNDGNKVAELTADELSFYQSGYKIASYTGSAISFFSNNEKLMEIKPAEIGFYYNGNKVFYISSGKIYSAGDMEITAGKKLIITSGVLDVDTTNFKVDSANKRVKAGNFVIDDKSFRIEKQQDTEHVLNVPSYFVVGDKDNYDYSSSGHYAGILYKNHLGEINDGGTYHEVLMPEISFFANNQGNAKLYNLRIVSELNNETNIYDDTVSQFKHTNLGTSDYPFDHGYINTLHTTSQYQISSRKRKHSIEPMKPPGDRLDQLKPVTFIYNDDRDERTRQGLIYEDTVEVMPEICTNAEKEEKAINYVELIPMLLKEIQLLRARVKTLEEGK